MKRKSIIALSILVISVSLCACNNNTNETANNDIVNSITEESSTVEESFIIEESSTVEESTEALRQETQTPTFSYAQGNTINESDRLTTDEEYRAFVEELKAIPEEDYIQEEIDKGLQVPEEYKAEEEEGTEAFTVTAVSSTMYATTNCRVRKGPSTDYEVTGTLNEGQLVNVTGKVNEADWYEIDLEGDRRYVSGSLLSDTKPIEQAAQTTTTTQTPSSSQSTDNSNQTQTPSPSNDTPSTGNEMINPYTGEVMKPGDSYVTPDGLEVIEGGTTEDLVNWYKQRHGIE